MTMTEHPENQSEFSKTKNPNIKGKTVMETDDLTLIAFTNSNPPKIRSHKSWAEVYEIIRTSSDDHEDPYIIEVSGVAVSLMNNGMGEVSATLLTIEKAHDEYILFGGVWVTLSE